MRIAAAFTKGSAPWRSGSDTRPSRSSPSSARPRSSSPRARPIAQVCKDLAITEQTYYRWRKEYGGLKLDQAKRLKELERENARLKRLLADAELDKAILKEAASGKY